MVISGSFCLVYPRLVVQEAADASLVPEDLREDLARLFSDIVIKDMIQAMPTGSEVKRVDEQTWAEHQTATILRSDGIAVSDPELERAATMAAVFGRLFLDRYLANHFAMHRHSYNPSDLRIALRIPTEGKQVELTGKLDANLTLGDVVGPCSPDCDRIDDISSVVSERLRYSPVRTGLAISDSLEVQWVITGQISILPGGEP